MRTVSLCCNDARERQDLILLMTRYTTQYGSHAFVEFWAVVRLRFLSDQWDDETAWQQEAAVLLGISDNAFRQRKYQFTHWIADVLVAEGYARQAQAKPLPLAA